MKRAILAGWVFLFSFGGSCGPLIEVDGFRLLERTYLEAEEDVSRRAGFDLNCPVDDLELTLLETNSQPRDRHKRPRQFGVRGCGGQAVYVWTRSSGWVMNTGPGAESQ